MPPRYSSGRHVTVHTAKQEEEEEEDEDDEDEDNEEGGRPRRETV
jgi:hypothetical protein